ncbi:MAG: ECF transporter S component [Christensenellales bacterium]
MSTRKLTTMAALVAISIVLVWLIHIPVFPPPVDFLEYDPADIAILIGAFAYGPVAGVILAAIAAVIQGVTVSAKSGLYGIIMHFIATGTLVVVAGTIYKYKKTRIGAAIGLIAGTAAMTLVMIPANLIVTPAFTGAPLEAVKQMILPFIIPFNLIKAGANSILTFAIYKTVSRFIKSEKKLGTANAGRGSK